MKVLRVIAPCLAAGLAAAALFAPALRLQLMSDDYQWAQLAHRALHHPIALVADLDGFFRPTATWTLAADMALWGHDPAGYHLTNLLLHATCAALLVAVCLSLGLSPPASLAIGLLWGTSPFAAEPAISVSSRHETLLLLSWFVVILAWPRRDGRWTTGRVVIVGAATALAALSKETWVVTPLLAYLLEIGVRRQPWRRALRTALPFAAAVAAYTVTHLLLLQGRSYFDLSLAPLAKVPHTLAAFLFLEGLVPLAVPFTWKGALALAACVATAVYAVRHRPAPALAGLALAAAFLPTLMVGTLPTRYTTIPYAGFLLVVAAALGGLSSRLRPPGRRAVTAGAGVATLLVLAAAVFTVRGDLADAARVSSEHTRLLAETARIVASLPVGRPFLMVRGENANPLRDIALSPRGLPKIYFVRHADPYGLIDSAALLEWALARPDIAARELPLSAAPPGAQAGQVLVHTDEGFRWVAPPAAGLAASAATLAGSGLHVKLVELVPP